jgi:hypothetical protein
MSTEMVKFLQAADPIYKNPILAFPLTATDRLVLEANVAKLYAIPSNTGMIQIIGTASICVLFGGSNVEATIPDEYDEDVLDGTAPMLDPGLICGLPFGTAPGYASIISSEACTVYIQRWSRR